MHAKKFLILFTVFLYPVLLHAQDDKRKLATTEVIDTSGIVVQADTSIVAKDSVILKDTLAKKAHIPQKATRRSAIIPGWGQIYNGQYWKLPLVYGALAVPTVTFIYNNTWYKKTRDAYTILITEDTARYDEIDPKLEGLSAQDLQYYRNDFRRNRDYSVLFFLIAWGLNVVDATVSGHLKEFNVSDDLSMKIQPQYNPLTKSVNVGLAFHFRNPEPRSLSAF
ncbi:MAG TPA: DUF5683 domain-containing protein [Panacibacter sp.]|nr:DUF5683 domain-containing protein [Panacibacter sp.]HNP46800.1 DUF5683 domain-containing protein [Panacibacter sp.]